MRHTALIAVALSAALAPSSACKRRQDSPGTRPVDHPPRLGPVMLEDRTQDSALPPEARIDPEALSAKVEKRLREARVFAGGPPDAGSGPTARVRVDIALEEIRVEDKAAARAVARLRVDTRPSGITQQHWEEDASAGADVVFALSPEPDRKALFGKLAERLVLDLTTGYLARQRLWLEPAASLRKTITADAGELRIEAIHAAAGRGLASEVPTLLALLDHQEETVRDAALGALVELRAQEAVGVIARQRSMRDRREMRKIIDAIATLGGQEASEYLNFVASGHDEEEIREMATQALDRLKRRQTATPPR